MAVSPEELDQRLAAKRKQHTKVEEPHQARAPAPRSEPPERQASQWSGEKPKRGQRSPMGKAVDVHRTPPHSADAEMGVIGSMLMAPEEAIPECIRAINRHYFYVPAHETIYTALVDLWEGGHAIDLITFTQALRDRKLLEKVGGAAFVTSLFTFVPTAANVGYYLEIVREKFLLREMISTGTMLVRRAYGAEHEEVDEILEHAGSLIDRIKLAAGGANGAINFDLDELLAFDSFHDPNCLVGRRFLVRGGSWMIAGPTGCGKSSLLIQLAIYWATGTAMFGVRPVRPLKSLIFQAEDDFGDVSEQLQGVFTGIQASEDLELEKFNEQIRKNLVIKQARGISGEGFLSMLEEYARLLKPDLVGINPLFAYAGCDISDPSIGTFLRDKLFAIGDKYRYCTVVMHHIAKPPRDGAEAANTMYLGFGSSEVQNSFRATSTIVPCKSSPGTWRFDFGKRTDRAGAKTPSGEFTDIVYMEHAQKGICWHQVEEPEGETGKADDILREMSFDDPIKAGVLQKKMSDEFGMAKRTFFRLWGKLKKSGNVKEIKAESGKGWVVIAAASASGANANF